MDSPPVSSRAPTPSEPRSGPDPLDVCATVRVGRRPGVYTTWDECAAQVNGWPGSVHKKFPTEAEAWAFVQGTAVDSSSTAGQSSSASASSNTQGTK